MEKKNVAIAPKIQAPAAEWLQEIFPSLNAGATFICNCFPNFYRYTIEELRGRFSLGELSMILDALNGHGAMLLAYQSSPSMIGHHLVLEVADTFRLYPGAYEEKWSIQKPTAFIERLKSLTMFQKICIEIWAAGFWESRHFDEAPETYCAPLLETKGEDHE